MNKPSSDNLFAFILGREQKIARAELECVLRHFGFCFSLLSLTGNVILINIEKVEDFVKSDIMSLLGGTMEIYQIIGVANKIDPDTIYSQISLLSEEKKGRVTFGISDYSKSFTAHLINTLGLEVKKNLKKKFSARFVALANNPNLSAAAIISNRLHKDGFMIGIFSDKNQYLFGKLISVSNPNEWSKRDFGKPKSDKYSGMTPPKLARAIINITLSQAMTNDQFPISNENSKIDKLNENCEFPPAGEAGKIENYIDFVVVDPFCGSGNILMEAMVLGCPIIGSDIDKKAVENTGANLDWIKPQTSNLITQNYTSKLKNLRNEVPAIQKYRDFDQNNGKLKNSRAMKQSNNEAVIFQADATRFDFDKILKSENKYIIVTEPYLGQPKKYKPTLNAVKGEYLKVKKLYLDFLENISLIKHRISNLAIIFPLVETMEGERYSLFDQSIDEIKKMGYTLVCEPFSYGRDYQVVKRQVVLFKITNNKSQNTNKPQTQYIKS